MFVFEEYSDMDVFAGTYSTIYFLDTEKDQFIAPSPFSTISYMNDDKGETMTLQQLRAESHKKAEMFLKKYRPQENPAHLYAANPPTEISDNNGMPSGHSIAFYTLRYPSTDSISLKLEDFVIKQNMDDCRSEQQFPRGFQLSMTFTRDSIQKDEFTDIIHKDSRIPSSRGCATGYRLTHVVGPESDVNREKFRYVAIIAVWTPGFEGAYQRYIAVPGYFRYDRFSETSQ